MKITIHTIKGNTCLNITAHHASMNKWWKEVQRSGLTCSAVKYCSAPRKAFGVYVIDGPSDAIQSIYQIHGSRR